MPKKASIKYHSLRSNLVHLPLSLYASLVQQQARPQGLILHLSPFVASSSKVTPKTAYLGWSGLAAASSLAGIGAGVEGETVEVDPEVAMGLGWPEGTIVEISIIHNPTKARSVSVTPLSADDWEILEQHASFLEDNLLGQLRAAQKGQEIDVWVGRTKIRIRVDDTDPSTTMSSAVLIHTETEIFVAPRPRFALKSEADKALTLPVSSAQSTSSRKCKKQIDLRLVPSRVAARWGSPLLSGEDTNLIGGGEAAVCSAATLRRVKRKLGLKSGDGGIGARLEWLPDEDEKISQSSADLSLGGATHAEEGQRGVETWLIAWDDMPDGCVVLTGQREERRQDWGFVRLTSATPNKGRSRGSRLGSSRAVLSFPIVPPSRRLPGGDALRDEAMAYLRLAFASNRPRSLLLLGAKGSGRTTLAKIVGEKLEADRDILAMTIYEDVARVDAEGKLGDIKQCMLEWMERAKRRSPCLLILDGLDFLLGPENELTPSNQPAVLADHFCRLLSTLPQGVAVLLTATSATSLHPLLSARHVFGETLKIAIPNKEVRAESLVDEQAAAFRGAEPSRVVLNGEYAQLDFVTLASSTEGYSAADLNDLVDGAVQQAMIRSSRSGDPLLHLTHEDFSQAQADFTPISLRGVTLQKSDVKWADIGGLKEPRRILRETLEWPTKYAQIFANCPLRLRSGLLLYGFPGCGKTLLASAVARECGLNFISVKGPEILNKYIGASERSVRDLFERASAAKPCVLFFDEFDSIAPKRGHDSTGVTDRVVNQMLTEMDGAQGLEGVYVLAATSRPDLIDPALLRPGRLDKSILCDMPSMADRLDILSVLAKKLTLDNGVMLDQIAAETDGFSGADLQAVLYNAHLEVVHSSIASQGPYEHRSGEEANEGKEKEKGKGKGKALENGPSHDINQLPSFRQLAPATEDFSGTERAALASRVEAIVGRAFLDSKVKSTARKGPKPVIHQVHLLRSLASTRPSVSPTDRARLQRIYKAFVSDRDGRMGDGDLGHETGTRMSLM